VSAATREEILKFNYVENSVTMAGRKADCLAGWLAWKKEITATKSSPSPHIDDRQSN